MSQTTQTQADLAKEYAAELEKAHKDREAIKERIFEIDVAIAQLLEVRRKLKAEL